MKTLLSYLTFSTLLTLCYIEKINAEAAKSQVRGRALPHHVHGSRPAWTPHHVTVARLRQ